MIPADRQEALTMAELAEQDADAAGDRAGYALDLAEALDRDRLTLVRHDWSPPSWTVTHQRAVLGEVTNDRPDAVLGGWTAHTTAGEPRGPFHTARAAASSLLPSDRHGRRRRRPDSDA